MILPFAFNFFTAEDLYSNPLLSTLSLTLLYVITINTVNERTKNYYKYKIILAS